MPCEQNAQGQFIRAESIVQSIGNKAEAKAKHTNENEARSDNMAENLIRENPGENPGINLQADTPREWAVPVLEKAETVKLVLFSINKLTKLNVQDWKNQMQRFLRMQDCWRVVELTEELKDEPDRMKKLLGTRNWEVANLKVTHYILMNIEQKDQEAVRNFDNAGKVWQYLLDFYLRNNDVNQMILIHMIITWKKDLAKDMDKLLQHLEKLNTDLSDSSNGKMNLTEKMIMAIFLEGLPKEFKATVDSLLAGRVYNCGIVLLRLHNVANWKTPGKEVGSKSTSNVKQLTCWNCGEVGYQKIDYPEPEKGSDDKKSGKKKSKSHGKDSNKGKSKGKKSDRESGREKYQKGKKKSY
jgi:hypothetical protein